MKTPGRMEIRIKKRKQMPKMSENANGIEQRKEWNGTENSKKDGKC